MNNNNNSVPEAYSLKQNFPNPFNPSTKIQFDVPRAGHVKLAVYNLLGNQVGLLADGFEDAGSHVISYDASRLASGIYFYRLEAEGHFETKKMILLK